MSSLRSTRTSSNRLPRHNDRKTSSERGTRSSTSLIMTPAHHRSKLAFAVASPRDVASFPSPLLDSPRSTLKAPTKRVKIASPRSTSDHSRRYNNMMSPRSPTRDLRRCSESERARLSDEKQARRSSILDRIEIFTNIEKQRVEQLWNGNSSRKPLLARSPPTNTKTSSDLPVKSRKSVSSDPGRLRSPPSTSKRGLPLEVPFPESPRQRRTKKKGDIVKSPTRQSINSLNDIFSSPSPRRASSANLMSPRGTIRGSGSRRTARQLATIGLDSCNGDVLRRKILVAGEGATTSSQRRLHQRTSPSLPRKQKSNRQSMGSSSKNTSQRSIALPELPFTDVVVDSHLNTSMSSGNTCDTLEKSNRQPLNAKSSRNAGVSDVGPSCKANNTSMNVSLEAAMLPLQQGFNRSFKSLSGGLKSPVPSPVTPKRLLTSSQKNTPHKPKADGLKRHISKSSTSHTSLLTDVENESSPNTNHKKNNGQFSCRRKFPLSKTKDTSDRDDDLTMGSLPVAAGSTSIVELSRRLPASPISTRMPSPNRVQNRTKGQWHRIVPIDSFRRIGLPFSEPQSQSGRKLVRESLNQPEA